MSAEAAFQNLIRRIRDLLNCASVSLLLGCSEPALRHPLLDLFPANDCTYFAWYGSSDSTFLLQDERVSALCDLAIQTGRVQCIKHFHLSRTSSPGYNEDVSIQCIAAAPLERSVGLLGLLLVGGDFYRGEIQLLNDYLPIAAQELEQDLRNLYAAPSQATTSAKKSALQEVLHGSTNIAHQKELDILKNEFISMISHDLRTPLSAIKGYAGLLQAYSIEQQSENGMADLTPARQQQYLDIIMEQTNHLEVLIGDLLDVSRIQAGRLALRFTSVDIAALCSQVTQVAQYRVDQQQPERYTIRCVLAPELPPIWADPDRVQQVLTNLLENAIKYSPEGGQIEVVAYARRILPPFNGHSPIEVTPSESAAEVLATRGPSMMHITVRDQGIGISHQQQKHLFRPFSRLEQPSTEQIPGAGLGLYISRKLIEAMGGSVIMRSREGEGTSITFTLPIALSGEAILSETTSVPFPSNHRLRASVTS